MPIRRVVAGMLLVVSACFIASQPQGADASTSARQERVQHMDARVRAKPSHAEQVRAWVKAMPPAGKLDFTRYITGWDVNRAVRYLNKIDPVFKFTFGAYIAAVQKQMFEAYIIAANKQPCGGSLPPCYVLDRESGHRDGIISTYDIHAENPKSTAAGKWQMLIGTSNNVALAMGRPDLVGVPASQWSEADQDRGAEILWANGAGCSHWEACGRAA